MSIWVADIETNGLYNPDKIHVLSISNTSGSAKKSTNNLDDMKKFLSSAQVIIGHYFSVFDIRQLERLLGVKYKGRIVDTLALSWVLFPDRGSHGLESWGETLGVKKPEIENWEDLSYEEYKFRCEQDVEINRLLWKRCYRYLRSLYGTDEEVWKYLDYLSFKMYCVKLQEESGWHLDVQMAETKLKEMEALREEKVKELFEAMPKVPRYVTREKPKVFFKKNGEVSSHGQRWMETLAKNGLPADHEGPIKDLVGFDDPNPASPQQVKDWLTSLGWVPRTFKHVKDSEGNMKSIPQINMEHGKGICQSIKDLYEIEPRLEVLDGLSILNHRIPLIKGMLGAVRDGKTTASVQGLTNTLRFQHAVVVNLPKVEKPYGDVIRGMLVAPDGYILCGSDMSSLEDRIKQHFIYPLDPKYVESMNEEGFDPHLTIAGLAGMMTQEEIEAYKKGDKSKKPIRDIAKNGNYACQYLAGPPRLAITCGIDLKAATALHTAYWKLNWAVKEVASQQFVKTVEDKMWLKNPVNGFFYSLRNMKDVFSTLVQGTASYVFDMWLKNILDRRPQLTGQFHDEFIICIKEGYEEQCTKLIRQALEKLNKELKLNRELDCGIQYGIRYSEIH